MTDELVHRHVDGWCLACMTEGGRLALNLKARNVARRRTHARRVELGGRPGAACGIATRHGELRPGYRPPVVVDLELGDQPDVTCGLCRRILRFSAWRSTRRAAARP